MKRVVQGLKWARRLASRPSGIPEGRARGAKLKGLQYERALAKALGSRMLHGIWWEFEDSEGRGFCQTDFLGFARGFTVILECKYTWTEEAEEELRGLYVPVVSVALAKPLGSVLSVVVCKNLIKGLKRPICDSLAEALETSYSGLSTPVWHHTGAVPLLRRSGATHLDLGAKAPILGAKAA